MAFTTRNGKRSIAPTSLTNASSVKPIIRKGRRINQMIGKTTINSKATGQQSTSRIHQSNTAISVRINKKEFVPIDTNSFPNQISLEMLSYTR